MGVGGGGWSAGFELAVSDMSAAIASGYATSTIDGGVPTNQFSSAASWALTSPGNVNYEKLHDFASRGLIDGALIAKEVIKSYYSSDPNYSYWNGCSQGGRQGLIFAQRYPDVFDGVVANAPAINWNAFFTSSTYPVQVLLELGHGNFPHPCEYDSLRQAAIAACDDNDDMADGSISDPDRCFFSSQTLIGTPAKMCNSSDARLISEAAAVAMNAVWHGPQSSNGTSLWYGYGYYAPVTEIYNVLASTCSNSGCVPNRVSTFIDWLQLFILKDPERDVDNLTREEWVSAFHAGEREYASIINSNNPDLSEFRHRGGKLLTFHGLVSFPTTDVQLLSTNLLHSGRPTDSFRRHARLLQQSVYLGSERARLLSIL